MPPLTPRSARVKAARRLARRASRASERRFLAEGPQAVREALGREGCAVEVYAGPGARERHADLVQLAAATGVPWLEVDAPAIAALSDTVTPQGVVAVCAFVDVELATALAGSPRLVAICAQARDPGNVGSVVRAADAAGADAVVVAGDSVDVYNGKAVRASAGSLFHLPIVVGAPVDDVVAAARSAGLAVWAAAGGGVDLDDLVDRGELAAPTAWLFGNEAWGLPEDLAALADRVVGIPLYGRAESLNLATAAAVCLYASARAQRVRPG